MVVSYSRPFNSSGESNVGSVPPLTNELEAILSEEELEIHKYLRWCRNKYLAHSDAKAVDPMPFVATDLPNNIVIPSKVDALAPFTKEYTESVLRLMEKVYHWSVEERHRIEPEIKNWLPVEKWN
jgi:DNA topoisomerase VI subunit B